MNWYFWWITSDQGYAISKAKTALNLKYTLHKLRSSLPKVNAVWLSRYPNLLKHQKSQKFAKESANKMDRQLLNFKPRKTVR
ncbi:DUF922 domain-containing protein [Pseudoalteromonas sp. SMS1]|uniref:DUF922 domain-containing protein n=1 Tax=Pseudoalteromonas sp. SMS1 TaxID=2908894 RepID=UPI003FA77F56